jgi:hypothetical protein
LAAFSRRHRALPIGALASFASANGLASAGEFAAAAAAYGRCGQLKVARLGGFAAIAGALASARAGEGEAAGEALISVASDGAQPSTVRAAAWYLRALLAYGDSRPDVARSALEAMGRLPEQGVWGARAALLSLALR